MNGFEQRSPHLQAAIESHLEELARHRRTMRAKGEPGPPEADSGIPSKGRRGAKFRAELCQTLLAGRRPVRKRRIGL